MSGLDVGIQVLQRTVPAMRQREKGASESEGETQSPYPQGGPNLTEEALSLSSESS